MTKVYTALLLFVSLSLLAETPVVPEYGKLLVLENRTFKSHWEMGLDGGIAMDNSSEDVYSVNALVNYVTTPLLSFGLEFTYNHTDEKAYLKKLKEQEDIKITSFTPDFYTQVTGRIQVIKGHLNFLNKIYSPFEMSLILGGGFGYNSHQKKSSSLASWGGEILIPFGQTYKGSLGIRHYKSYPFQTEELSYTSLLFGVRKSL